MIKAETSKSERVGIKHAASKYSKYKANYSWFFKECIYEERTKSYKKKFINKKANLSLKKSAEIGLIFWTLLVAFLYCYAYLYKNDYAI